MKSFHDQMIEESIDGGVRYDVDVDVPGTLPFSAIFPTGTDIAQVPGIVRERLALGPKVGITVSYTAMPGATEGWPV